MSDPSVIDSVVQQVNATNAAVRTGSVPQSGDQQEVTTPSAGSSTPGDQAAGVAVQSVAQSMAIAISDATDMLRNISTVATTAIGVATAKWIETPEQVLYASIIESSQKTITTAAEAFATIGASAGETLSKFPQGEKPTGGSSS